MTAKDRNVHAPCYHFETVGSTNAVALDYLREGTRPPFWVIADEQTTGRGRSGRAWSSPKGNVYATVALAIMRPVSESPTLAFAAALAVHDTIAAMLAGTGVVACLKWPNDVLADGGKISGILLQSHQDRANGLCAVIGCGINCASAPALPDRATTSLMALGGAFDPKKVFQKLQLAMEHRSEAWNAKGLAGIRGDWMAAATGYGEPITVRLADETIAGVFDGMADDGSLLVRLENGTHRIISAGDVFVNTGRPVARQESG